jgi:hypothetical protein
MPSFFGRTAEGVVSEPLISGKKFGLVFLLLLVAALLPFGLCSPLPLGDYTNHLARIHIITNLNASPDLARYYAVEWAVIPNLASDILVPWLAHLGSWSVESVLTGFAAVALALLASGAVVLNRVLYGRWSYFALTVFLLLFNRHFLWGFLNYIFTLGVMLWLPAAWLYCRERYGWPVRLLFAVPTTLLFFGHLFPLGVYGVCVMGYEARKTWSQRGQRFFLRQALLDVFVAGVQYLPALVLLLRFSPTAGRAGDIAPSNISDKLAGLFDPFNNYSTVLDVGTWLLIFGLFFYGLVRKTFRIHPGLLFGLLTLTLIYCVMPNGMFASGGADRRLMAAVFILFAAALGDWSLSAIRRRQLLLLLLALFVVRMGVVSWNWHRADDIYARYIKGMDVVEEGSRVAYLMTGPSSPWLQNPPLDHLGNLIVVRRNVFINGLFAEHGQQVVHLKYNLDTPFYKFPSNTYRLNSEKERASVPKLLPLDRFDFVYVIGARNFTADWPERLQSVWRDDEVDATLFRVGPAHSDKQ